MHEKMLRCCLTRSISNSLSSKRVSDIRIKGTARIPGVDRTNQTSRTKWSGTGLFPCNPHRKSDGSVLGSSDPKLRLFRGTHWVRMRSEESELNRENAWTRPSRYYFSTRLFSVYDEKKTFLCEILRKENRHGVTFIHVGTAAVTKQSFQKKFREIPSVDQQSSYRLAESSTKLRIRERNRLCRESLDRKSVV